MTRKLRPEGAPAARGWAARLAVVSAVCLTGSALVAAPVAAGVVRADANAASRSSIRPLTKTGKLSPRLRELAGAQPRLSVAQEAAALSLPATGPGSLVRKPGGRVLVQIRTSSTAAAAVARLKALGAEIVNVSPAYKVVTASVAPGALNTVAADPDVVYASEVLAPITGAAGVPRSAAAAQPATGCNPTIPEGDSLMNVASARAANNLDGTGETIGVLSDSFNKAPHPVTTAAQDVATGDLPGTGNPCGRTTPVTVQSDFAGGGQTDEGRGVAELAHAMAPGARLVFATSSNGELDFANRITALRTTNHANVLVDDSAYIDEPFFQDGPVANAANAASAAGVAYFSAAGNSNVFVGANNVSSYETPSYRPMTCPASVQAAENPAVQSCHDFAPGAGTDNTDDITVAAGGGFGIDLQWAQPWGAVTNDYDLFLINSAGSVVASSTVDQSAFEEPVEFVGYTNNSSSAQTVRLVIAKFAGGADSRMKFVFVGAAGISAVAYHTSFGGDIIGGAAIFGHNGAATVGTTAAIPYNNSNTSEPYSSRGPVTHYFQPTPSTTALGSPDVIAKPDFAATDAVKSKFGFVINGVRRFPGTSASVAQAAGIGALLRERDPALSPAAVMSTLSGTARSVSTDGAPTDVGGGYLDASAALASVVPMPTAPTGVVAANGDSQSMLQWTAAVSNPNFPVTDYIVTPTQDGIVQAPIDAASSTPGLLVTGLTDGSTYTFTVAAVNANGTGADSAPSNAVDLGVPDAPTSVSGLPGDGEAQLSWTAPPPSGLTITGYVVTPFIGAAAQTPQSFSDPATTQAITGLADGTTYTFEVAAVDSFTTGPESAASSEVTVGAPGPTAAPALTYHGSSVSLTWSAPATDNGSPVTGYDVLTIEPGEVVVGDHSVGSVTSFDVTGLTSGQSFTFAIVASNARGFGARSPESRSVTAGTPLAPAAPSPKASGNASATLSWHPPASGPAASTGYVLEAYVGSTLSVTKQFNSTATTETMTGLTNGTTYRFTVAGVNGSGVGEESAKSAPLEAGLPGAPSAVGTVNGNGAVTVHWKAAAGNGSPVTKYVVTPYLGSAAQTAHGFNSAATTETVSGLSNGKQYTFKVAAINAHGIGPKSSASSAIRVGVPRSPTGVSATTDGTGTAKVHWTAPSGDGSSITGYIITPYVGTVAGAPRTYHKPLTTQLVKDLHSGKVYTFKVAAVNARGTGNQSTASNKVQIK